MNETLKKRLIAWGVITGMGLIAGLVLCPFVGFEGFLCIFVGVLILFGIPIMVFGLIPTGSGSMSVEEFTGDEPPPNFDETTDAFDETLGLKPKDEKELSFDELIAWKSDKKSD